MPPSWVFREMGRGEINVDPVHDEFFKAQDLADALVRETIQNSLDARRGNNKVQVCFRFGTLDAEHAGRWLIGLREHLEPLARESRLNLPPLDGPMPYLAIEDFGTRGLSGDPRMDPELDESSERNDFFYFWRNVGRSSKGDLDRGRWGLGKAVFSVASQIRSLFGITRRLDDDLPLLLGQAVLKTHVLAGARFDPYGFFAEMRDDFPLPFDKPKVIARFAEDFGIARDERGLSVVVPFPRSDDLSFERLAAATIQQYFYPIIRGDLAVTIRDAQHRESIDADSVEEVATRYLSTAGDKVARLCALTRWSLGAAEGAISLPEPDARGAPKWDERLFSSLPLEAMRERFDAGERVAIRVPLLVKRKKTRAANSSFDVFLEQAPDLDRPEHHYIRRGITIPEAKSKRRSDQLVRALVVIDQEALSTFLGDAENPAHSDWSERADKIRNQYDHGASTLRFVKDSVAFIASVLSRPPEGRVRDFFAEVFSIGVPDDNEDQHPGPPRLSDNGGDEGTASAPKPGSFQRTPGLSMTRTGDGFVIKGRNPAMAGRIFDAQIAYRLHSGNPFSKYSPWDFDLESGAVSVAASGATLKLTRQNRFQFVPLSADFQVAISGFDPRRDLVVRVTELMEEEEHAAETELH